MAINSMGMQSWVRKHSLNFIKDVENILHWKAFQRKCEAILISYNLSFFYIDILFREFNKVQL
jgi:hypothetical protein